MSCQKLPRRPQLATSVSTEGVNKCIGNLGSLMSCQRMHWRPQIVVDCWILPAVVWCCLVLPDVAWFRLMLPDVVWCCLMIRGVACISCPNSCWTVVQTVVDWWILPDVLWCLMSDIVLNICTYTCTHAFLATSSPAKSACGLTEAGPQRPY